MFRPSFFPVFAIVALLAFVSSVPVFAGSNQTPHLDKREANQAKRIAKGVQDGNLTGQEAARLQAMEAKLSADEAAAKADGKVTKQERKVLHQAANADSKAIHALKHNAEKASAKKSVK